MNVLGQIALIIESYMRILGQFETFVRRFGRFETNLRHFATFADQFGTICSELVVTELNCSE